MTEVAFTYEQWEWKNTLPWPATYKTVINVRDQERFEKDLSEIMAQLDRDFKVHAMEKRHKRHMSTAGDPARTAHIVEELIERSKGNIISIARYRNKMENDGLKGEAQYVSFHANGNPEKIIHKTKGKLNNAGKIPAVQEFHPNGERALVEMHLNGNPYAAEKAQVGDVMMAKTDSAGKLLDGRILTRGQAVAADEHADIRYETVLSDLSPELYASIRANEENAKKSAEAAAAQEGTVLQRAFGKDAKIIPPKVKR